ncbi:MAG: sortase domain-bontaining protein [Actinomycetes bacterium]
MTTDTTPRQAVRRARGRGLTFAGLLLLALGLGALGWASWDTFVRPVVDAEVAAAQVAALRDQWSGHSAAATPSATLPSTGDAVALITIEGLNDAAPQVVLAGTDDATLTLGLGWYDGTTPPGELGNFAVAGRGDPNGPLAGLASVPAGTRVVIETAEAVHTYQLRERPGDTVVAATDTWVIQPVPGRPELRPTEALLTITSTYDLFRPDTRLVAFGVLVETRPR